MSRDSALGGGGSREGHRHHRASQSGSHRVLREIRLGRAELVPLVTVQNLARALNQLNDIGFMTVGLDSEELRISAQSCCGSRWRWCSAPKARACGN